MLHSVSDEVLSFLNDLVQVGKHIELDVVDHALFLLELLLHLAGGVHDRGEEVRGRVKSTQCDTCVISTNNLALLLLDPISQVTEIAFLFFDRNQDVWHALDRLH